MTKEALRLALEALKETWYHVGTFAPTDEAIELYDQAITAIKAELEADTWVGLTDEEIATISKETHFESKPVTAFARAIEAKLKEKNNVL